MSGSKDNKAIAISIIGVVLMFMAAYSGSNESVAVFFGIIGLILFVIGMYKMFRGRILIQTPVTAWEANWFNRIIDRALKGKN